MLGETRVWMGDRLWREVGCRFGMLSPWRFRVQRPRAASAKAWHTAGFSFRESSPMATVTLYREELEDNGLPPFCMRCGEPATLVKHKRFSWGPGWAVALLAV